MALGSRTNATSERVLVQWCLVTAAAMTATCVFQPARAGPTIPQMATTLLISLSFVSATLMTGPILAPPVITGLCA